VGGTAVGTFRPANVIDLLGPPTSFPELPPPLNLTDQKEEGRGKRKVNGKAGQDVNGRMGRENEWDLIKNWMRYFLRVRSWY
jgi:hypothetical protein